MKHAEHAERTVITLHGQPVEPAEAATGNGEASIWTTADDTAARLGVSRYTVIRAFQAGLIPGIKFGATYNLLRAFVDDLVDLVHTGRGVDFEEFAQAWPNPRPTEELAS